MSRVSGEVSKVCTIRDIQHNRMIVEDSNGKAFIANNVKKVENVKGLNCDGLVSNDWLAGW